MSPHLPPSTEPLVPAEEALSALQQAWTNMALPPPAEHVLRGEPRLPLRDSFLSLRDIPQISFEDARTAFPMTDPGYPAPWKEQIRQLRNRLNDAQAELQDPDDVLQVVAFTSMDSNGPRYGTAANLALAMASIQDTRVLVVDANLSAPNLHKAMRVPAGPGLCEATRADRMAMPQCFRRVAGTQIYFLTVGDTDTFPTEPLDVRGLHMLMQSLRSQFDWIILDSPGFDTTTDAMVITAAADGVIMMIESEADSYRTVAKALRFVQGRRMLGAVMF